MPPAEISRAVNALASDCMLHLNQLIVPSSEFISSRNHRLRLGKRITIEVSATHWAETWDWFLTQLAAAAEQGCMLNKPVDYWDAVLLEKMQEGGRRITS
jgi:hypothetical protein